MAARAIGGKCFLLYLLCLFASVAHSGPLSKKERKQDPRLEKPVTLLGPRVYYLGELLEELSKQTGVTLEAGEKDKASGETVVLRVQNVPLVDVLNGLWSLVSYENATWDWEALPAKVTDKTVSGENTYRLVRPRSAQIFGAILRQNIQKSFELEAAAIVSNLEKSGESLKELEKKSTPGVYQSHKRAQSSQEAFAEIVPSTQARLRLLRGHETVQIPVGALGEKARAYVETEFALKSEWNSTQDYPKPTHVKLVCDPYVSGITPSLMILVGNEHSMEGVGCIGGRDFEKKWRQAVTAQWLLAGDTAEDLALETKVATPQKGAAPAKPFFLNPPDMRLWQCAEGASVAFIACVTDRVGDRGSPYDKTLRVALTKLDPLQTKWRNGILLARDPSCFMKNTEEGRISWSVVKKLRAAELATRDGLLPLQVLADTARELSPEQLQNLSGEFAVLGQVAKWHNWFVQMSQTPGLIERLQSPKGVPIQIMRVLSKAVLPPEVSADRIVSIRMGLEDSPRTDKEIATRFVKFEMLGSGGVVLGHSSFFYQERRHQEPISPDGTSMVPDWVRRNNSTITLLPQPPVSASPTTP